MLDAVHLLAAYSTPTEEAVTATYAALGAAGRPAARPRAAVAPAAAWLRTALLLAAPVGGQPLDHLVDRIKRRGPGSTPTTSWPSWRSTTAARRRPSCRRWCGVGRRTGAGGRWSRRCRSRWRAPRSWPTCSPTRSSGRWSVGCRARRDRTGPPGRGRAAARCAGRARHVPGRPAAPMRDAAA
jgi:hypothetical protein